MEREANKPSQLKIILFLILGHTFWGFSFMASRIGLDHADMFVMLSHRFLIAFFALSLLALLKVIKLNFKGKRIILLFFLGLAEPIVYFVAELYGIMHSNTIFSGVMIAMIPIVSTLTAAPILGEKPTLGQLIFSAISVGGVIGIGLMSSDSGVLEVSGVIGLAIAVLSAVAYTLLCRSISTEFSPVERTYSMVGMGAVFFTAIAVINCGVKDEAYFAPLADQGYLLSILFLGICCSVGSYFFSAYTLTYLTVARQTVFANLTTAVSVLAGAIFLDEHFSPIGILYCLMIFLGIYGVQREAKE